MGLLVIIPVLALLGLTFISWGKALPTLRQVVLVWIVGLAVFFWGRSFFSDRDLYPASESVKRVEAQLRNLRKQKDWAQKPILILEGSSVTLFGIDGEALQRKLAELGIDATVLQFSMAGANHFERLNMLEEFLALLTSEERSQLERADVTFLSEVFQRYDEDPLYLFDREAYSERAIVYLEPSRALAAARAYAASPGGGYWWPLVENTLFNQFAVGAFSDMQIRGKVRRIGGFFPLADPNPTFNFAKSYQAFQDWSAGPPKHDFSLVPYAGWQIYFETFRNRLGGVADRVVFFAMPSLEPRHNEYPRAFARNLPQGAFMLTLPPPELYGQLGEETAWFDANHPREKGARLFTDWLAREIAAQWPVLTGRAEPPAKKEGTDRPLQNR